MNQIVAKLIEFDSDQSKSSSPSTKKPLLNSSLRKYAKPVIFKESVPENIVFKNLAGSFKVRPSIRISNFKLKPSKIEKTKLSTTIKPNITQKPNQQILLNTTNLFRQNTPTKYKASKKRNLKPLFRHYLVNDKKIEIEGKPCSRSLRYPFLESKTPEVHHFRNYSNDGPTIYVELKKS